VGTVFVPPEGVVKDRLLAKLMVKLPGGTVITTGDQFAPAFGFAVAQVTPPVGAAAAEPTAAVVFVPQTNPHMGTLLPSGKTMFWGIAGRPTDWAKDTPTPKRIAIANCATFVTAFL